MVYQGAVDPVHVLAGIHTGAQRVSSFMDNLVTA